jgi:hypothetical protein
MGGLAGSCQSPSDCTVKRRIFVLKPGDQLPKLQLVLVLTIAGACRG